MTKSRVFAVALTLGMAAAPVLPVIAQPAPTMQDRDQDRNRDRDRDRDNRGRNDNDRNNQWANNKYYKMGEKDADNDRRHNRQGKHNRKFKNDDDRRAYEAGYGGQYARGPR
jgi:hypothetical protein